MSILHSLGFSISWESFGNCCLSQTLFLFSNLPVLQQLLVVSSYAPSSLLPAIILLLVFFLRLISSYFMHMAVLPACMSAHYAYAVPEETRRQHPSLWNRSDRWLLAIFCGYRELNPGPRESSRCLNSGVTSGTPWFCLFNLTLYSLPCQFG